MEIKSRGKFYINEIIKLILILFIFHTDDDQMQRRLLCDKGHLLEIEATFVTRALREFIERYHFVKSKEAPETFQEKLTEKKTVISRNMTIQDITDFWKRYSEIFPAKKERLWDGLFIGLKKYHEILKERHRLNTEVKSLRTQNAELHRLLKTYIIQVSPERNIYIYQINIALYNETWNINISHSFLDWT